MATGLGTFNNLDGEMIGLDGEFYQIKADGIAYPVDDLMKTSFAVVMFFVPDKTIVLEKVEKKNKENAGQKCFTISTQAILLIISYALS